MAQGGRIIASGGLAQHHEQIEELWAFDPDTLLLARSASFLGSHGDCATCHNPHGSTVKQEDPNYTGMPGVDKSNSSCLSCHALFDPQLRSGGMESLNCIDCHMPKMVRTAESTPPVGAGPLLGDISSHIFTIRLGLDEEVPPPQLTEDGRYQYPYITADYACRTCHNGVDLWEASDGLMQLIGFKFHNNLPSMNSVPMDQ